MIVATEIPPNLIPIHNPLQGGYAEVDFENPKRRRYAAEVKTEHQYMISTVYVVLSKEARSEWT